MHWYESNQLPISLIKTQGGSVCDHHTECKILYWLDFIWPRVMSVELSVHDLMLC